MHGGDRAVSADQPERLVPGTWLVEQGSYDRGDVGAGDSARGGTGGGASRIVPVAGASMRPPGAHDSPVQIPGAQIGLSGGLRRDAGSPGLITAGPRRAGRQRRNQISHREHLHQPTAAT